MFVFRISVSQTRLRNHALGSSFLGCQRLPPNRPTPGRRMHFMQRESFFSGSESHSVFEGPQDTSVRSTSYHDSRGTLRGCSKSSGLSSILARLSSHIILLCLLGGIWVWLKIKQGGLRMSWSMFPLTRVPIWYRCFEPQPYIIGSAVLLVLTRCRADAVLIPPVPAHC